MHSPLLYIQSNGWGMTNTGKQTISWGHEGDVQDAFDRVNLAFQALGTNVGQGWMPQGDWVGLVELARKYQAAYLEIYPPDVMPPDTKHRIVEAFNCGDSAEAAKSNLPPGFIGFRPWLKQRRRVLYLREGTIRQRFCTPDQPRQMAQIRVEASQAVRTRIATVVRSIRSGRLDQLARRGAGQRSARDG